MMKTGILMTLAFGALVAFSACVDRTEDARLQRSGAETAGPRIDTTDIGGRYREIDSLHALMIAQYDTMESEMPEPMRRLYGSMNEMHGSASQMHRAMMRSGMMGPDGRMGEDRRMGEDHMMEDEGMMGRGMHGGMTHGDMMNLHRTREWDQQMAAMHAQMGAYMREQGYDEMASLHEEMTGRYQGMMDALPDDVDPMDENEDAEERDAADDGDDIASGRSIFSRECAACHGPDGEGLAGVFPPLSGSEWVTGDPEIPVRILLAGLHGPIEVQGESYDGTMPAFGARLSNAELAAVASFIRSAWQNDAGRITPREVRPLRREAGSRTEPWTAEELR